MKNVAERVAEALLGELAPGTKVRVGPVAIGFVMRHNPRVGTYTIRLMFQDRTHYMNYRRENIEVIDGR